ncbi:MAG: iron-sulfur cluster assembly scaffold protein [Candidatus Omnitrophica bacterium]|nr:iron-sulfur cluster assembly scaffold protein [Candidatus Omnitrophota bacterium]
MDKNQDIPLSILSASQNNEYFGRMNDASASACSKGLCGDEMEFYLVITHNIIIGIKFYTDGCLFTKACGTTVARLALKKSLSEALNISPQLVVETIGCVPKDYLHCSILAVGAFHKAIADYLLKP